MHHFKAAAPQHLKQEIVRLKGGQVRTGPILQSW
jgi:hypothetical protein